MKTPQQELEILRVSLARIAQACSPEIELEIPGAQGRTGLNYHELAPLARDDRGWNRLASFIVDHCLTSGKTCAEYAQVRARLGELIGK